MYVGASVSACLHVVDLVCVVCVSGSMCLHMMWVCTCMHVWREKEGVGGEGEGGRHTCSTSHHNKQSET